MINQKLLFARAYEKEMEGKIGEESRPKFHFSPCVGWTNDPNGFSYYKGMYHLFYQSNPYDTVWDSMHWGHAVSRDLLHWEYLPAAMAPDEAYDDAGCFSGSALELDDGRQLLMYTGVHKEGGDHGEELQTQCIAVGDGLDYKKYEKNPVLDASVLPEGLSRNDFRDPKIWKGEDGRYHCVVGARRKNRACGEDTMCKDNGACGIGHTQEGEASDLDGLGAILLFGSPDGFSWNFESVLVENDGRFGKMWECPDFFLLDGKYVLLCSPQDMLPEGFEYHNGNGTLCLIGDYDKTAKKFSFEKNQTVDYGIDFYATQTTLTPDGRRIMIAWMQNWDTCDQNGAKERKWFGQMTLPRELSIQDGRLYQRPVRELLLYRSNKVEYQKVGFEGELSLDGVEGRIVDMELTIRRKEGAEAYKKFAVRFAQDERYRTALSYRPYESILKLDRKFSGSRRAYIHQRRSLVREKDGELKLRIILDRFSVEVFINDGEQVMTATVMTDGAAKGISFFADGEVVMDVTKYTLF